MSEQVFELEFSCHAPNLLRETIQAGLRPAERSALAIPLQVFCNFLLRIAERASQLNDPILNDLMCKLALYSVADPDLPEYDREIVAEVAKRAAAYLKEQNPG